MTDTKRFYLCAAVVAGLLLAAYSNHFYNGFHFDDGHTIQNNLYIRNLANIPRFFTDGSTFSALPSNQSYRPMVSATLAIDYYFANGLNPFAFHVSTFLLYVMQGVLLFSLFLRVSTSAVEHRWSRYFALGLTALYLLNTTNAETINYIIARSDSLSTQGVLGGLVIYLYSPRVRKTLLYLLPVVLGILAKPTAAVFAPLLFVYLWLFEERAPRRFERAVWRSLPAFAVCAAAFLFVDRMTPPSWSPGGASRWQYLLTQPFVILHYAQMFVMPTQLSADTDWTMLESPWDPRFLFGVAFLLVLAGIAVRCARRRRTLPVAFGIAWYLLALLPTAVVPLAEVMNDHRMFFPNVGLALALGWLVILAGLRLGAGLGSRARAALAAGLALLVFSGEALATHQRNQVWLTDDSLWLDVTEKSPRNGRALMNYGLSQMEAGHYPVAKRYFEAALVYAPAYSYLHVNLAILANAMGDPAAAERYFKQAFADGPAAPDVYSFYADFLIKQKRVDEAITLLRRALELTDANLAVRHSLMAAYAAAGRWDDLSVLTRQTVAVLPDDEVAQGYQHLADGRGERAAALLAASAEQYGRKEFDEVIETCTQALLLQPTFPEAYNNLCSAYNELGRFQEGAAACTRALEQRPDFELARNNLRWAEDELAKRR